MVDILVILGKYQRRMQRQSMTIHLNPFVSVPCEQSGHPPGCELEPNPQETCERGAQAKTMLLVTGLLPTLIAFFTVTVAVILLIHAVLVQERRMDQFQRTGRNRKMTMESFQQGMFYIGAFAISWTPWLVFGFKEYTVQHIHAASYYAVLVVTPLQGVLNAVVYFRPRLKAERERNPSDSVCKSLMQVLHIKCCCNRRPKDKTGDTAIMRSDPQADDAEIGNEQENSTAIKLEAAQEAEIKSEKKVTTSS